MLPASRFKKAKEKVFGKKYELDLVFTDTKMMKRLNRKYRKKNKDSNVLAFRLSPEVGQIFLNPKYIKKRGEDLFALYVHGLLHLKVYNHGKEMEKREEMLCRAI
jgi:rRNA maturation RNase YbeY